MRKIGSKKRFALVASTVAAVLIGSGVAVAFWTTSGTGNGQATTGTTTTLDIDQVGTITNLYPGITPVNINVEITNTGTNPQSLTTLNVSIDDSAFPVGCSAADYAVTNGTLAGGVNNIPVGTTPFSANGATITLINDLVNNQDACKGVTVPLVFSAS